MRVLVAVMVSIMLCLQPMISLNESNKNYEIVSFSSLQKSSVSDNWWEDTNMDKDKNRMHDILDIALEQGRYVVDGKISVLVDKISLDLINGSKIDYVDELIGSSFKVTNPKSSSSCGCGTSFSI